MRQPNPRGAQKNSRGGRPPAPSRTLSEILRTGATRAEAAAFLAVTGPTIDAFAKRGAPRRENGHFDLPELARWKAQRDQQRNALIEDDLDKSEELEKLRRARRRREELALARDVGRVLSREAVVEQLVTACTTVRVRLNLLVLKCAPTTIACRTVDEAEEVLQREVDEILNSFRQGLDVDAMETEQVKELRERGIIKPEQLAAVGVEVAVVPSPDDAANHEEAADE